MQSERPGNGKMEALRPEPYNIGRMLLYIDFFFYLCP